MSACGRRRGGSLEKKKPEEGGNLTAGYIAGKRARRERRDDGRAVSVSSSPYHMDKARKGIQGMPWRQVPKKDVAHCEKLR